MKLWKLLGVMLVALWYPSVNCVAMGSSPEGRWTTLDDATGNKRAQVKLTLSGNTLSGKILRVYSASGDTGVCSKCPAPFKDKKIQGLQFLWGLRDDGHGVWSSGSILDPKTGRIYRAKITMQGNKLLVRGYLGITAIGRTQTWVR